MKKIISTLVIIAVGTGIFYTGIQFLKKPEKSATNALQRLTNPGELSHAHASLEMDCRACHTSVKGAEATKCIICHANDDTLLQRQPTSFHADISSCRECHVEHQGRDKRPTHMDHDALTKIGLQQLNVAEDDSESKLKALQIKKWITNSVEPHEFSEHPPLTPQEAVLNCATCHQNDDRHFQLFGNDCAQCHSTTAWNIPEFIHPSSTSMDCAQCHQAPPSHYMKHFNKISKTVAGKPHARVDQCFVCHQTTSWPDIKGTGWYKHH